KDERIDFHLYHDEYKCFLIARNVEACHFPPFILRPFGEAQGRLSSGRTEENGKPQSSQETAFLFININGAHNHNSRILSLKREPNSNHNPCFLPTPFGLRTNILLRANGFFLT
ncbi:MAG: hypothetical protein WC091_25770, partial [Sulfuricellaceae bacterium]